MAIIDFARRLPPSVLEGARDSAPFAVAVGLFGVPFALLALEAGFTPAAAVLMSATAFAGSAQFASVAVLEAGGSAAAAILSAVLLNSRYLPMGLTVAPHMRGPAARRLLVGQLVVDESWAIAQTGRGLNIARLVGAGVLLYASWVAGTLAGALAGTALPSATSLGIDGAFPALFLALLAGTVRNRITAGIAVSGAALALALTPVLPPGVPLLLSAGAALIGLVR